MMDNEVSRQFIDLSTVWTLWYRDLFDRESPPSIEVTGRDILEGLYQLWLYKLREGLQDDGAETFSRFHLAWEEPETGYADVGVEPYGNPGLAILRQWAGLTSGEQMETVSRGKNRVIWKLANLHYELLLKSDRWTADTLYWSEVARELLAYVDTITDPDML